MIDLCQLTPLICQNNGQCAVNISLNTTYCQCDECHYGILCENDVWREKQFNTYYPRVIASVIDLCLSLLNNILIFELFVCCRRIRSTNCGIYLFTYSILSLLGYILSVIAQVLRYYPNQLTSNSQQNEGLVCFITGLDSDIFLYLCIWLSSLIAFERGLIVYSASEMNAPRWRSFVAIIIILAIAGSSIAPMIVYNCDWDNVPHLLTLRSFCDAFSIIGGIVIYIVATVLVLVSFARRIHYYYGTKDGSCIRTFFNLLKSHLFIFVPPIVYGLCQIPFSIAVSTKNHRDSYYQCGISFGQFFMKILMRLLTSLPYALTWLLFVFPSRVYMTDYYLNTWSGRRLATIIIFLKSYNCSKKNVVLPYTNPTGNEHNNPVFSCEHE